MGRSNRRFLPVACATLVLLLGLVVAALCAPRRPIPKAASAVDRAAIEIAETADATELVVRWVYSKCEAWDREGKIRGRLVFRVFGLPIAMLEAELDLPKPKG